MSPTQSDPSATTTAMPDRSGSMIIGAGPVSPLAPTAFTPLPLEAVRLQDGWLAGLQDANGSTSIVRGADHLEHEGAWLNFDRVNEPDTDDSYFGPCFEDGEVYKWLEAVAWEAGRSPDDQLHGWLTDYSARIAAAQAADGYLNTYVQRGQRSERYGSLAWDHEIFNNGALIQSAVAQYRTTGRSDLLNVAVRAADHLDATFGPTKTRGTCGHPLIEMALVELYRTTAERRYLDLASFFVEVRGHDLLDSKHGFGDAYHSDRIPVRDTIVPEGHAVRAVYLAAGATDLAIETGDQDLLDQLQLQWQNMVEQKTYVTGGLGSRWEGEAFGDPYELPSDRAYAETCAAIAGIQWSWRLLLATGEARYADFIERQLYNAVLPGISLNGDAYFYANALQLRTDAVATDTRMAAAGRQHWFGCSCCPTNIMRTLASLQAYVASTTQNSLQIHQLTAASIGADLDAGRLELTVRTDYPWSGTIAIEIAQAPADACEIDVRIPAWAEGSTVRIGNGELPVEAGRYLQLNRAWTAGDRIEIELPMRPRVTRGHHRVGATRGCVAIERGPLVYAVEAVDQLADVNVDDLIVSADGLDDRWDPDILGGVPVVLINGWRTATCRSEGPSTGSGRVATGSGRVARGSGHGTGEPVVITAIPYFLWANREVGPMRVWLPVIN